MEVSIGEEIKRQRKKQGLTQKELAQKANIAEVTLRKYEAESVNVSSDTLIKLARSLNLEDYYFLGFRTKEGLKHEEEMRKAVAAKDTSHLTSLEKLTMDVSMEYMNELSLAVAKDTFVENYNKLNDLGKAEAQKRVQELTEIPRYQKDNEEKE